MFMKLNLQIFLFVTLGQKEIRVLVTCNTFIDLNCAPCPNPCWIVMFTIYNHPRQKLTVFISWRPTPETS